VLQKRPITPTLKHHAIDYLRTKTMSFDYTLEVMHSLEQQVCLSIGPAHSLLNFCFAIQARVEIARLGGNPKLEMMLDILHV
jgi:geranylgeranyl diphosphate synthase type 3